MNANSRAPSAKIYQFPRKTATNAGESSRTRPAVDHRMRTVPTVEFGSGWYHEAAVQAEATRKS
jgi:hypothetical protein